MDLVERTPEAKRAYIQGWNAAIGAAACAAANHNTASNFRERDIAFAILKLKLSEEIGNGTPGSA